MNTEKPADNPYAAPKAAVADPEPAAMPDRPPQVARGVQFMWYTLPIGMVSSVINLFTLDQPGMSKAAQVTTTIVGLAIGLAISVWLISSTARGKNWARIVELVFVIFGALGSITMFTAPMIFHWTVWLLYAVQMTLSVWAMVLLFSPPANEWFRAMKR